MNPQAESRGTRRDRLGRPLKTNHPFPRALEEDGSSIEDWAKKHRMKARTVRTWYQDGTAGRRIDRVWADAIEKEFGLGEDGLPRVPATVATWKNGIR